MRQRKLLLVAATGGHLTQLVRLAPRFDASPDSVWVTFDTEQSRSMLAGKNTFYVPYISPRDWRGTIRAFLALARVLRKTRVEAVYSTGAAVALAAFLQPRLVRTPKVYIESVSRIQGPSLTGRIAAFLPSVAVFTQHQGWATKRWRPIDSVLDQYTTDMSEATRPPKLKIFVTLGTIRPYRFDALIDAVLGTGLANNETIWQLGVTQRENLPGHVVRQMPADDFLGAAKEADVVITHAGVGTVIQLLEMGISPVVVPRSSQRQEHVDNHQFEIAQLLIERELAVVTQVDELSDEHIMRAYAQRTDVNV